MTWKTGATIWDEMNRRPIFHGKFTTEIVRTHSLPTPRKGHGLMDLLDSQGYAHVAEPLSKPINTGHVPHGRCIGPITFYSSTSYHLLRQLIWGYQDAAATSILPFRYAIVRDTKKQHQQRARCFLLVRPGPVMDAGGLGFPWDVPNMT